MSVLRLLGVSTLLATGLAQAADRPNFAGKWNLKSGDAEVRTLVIEQDGDKIEIRNAAETPKHQVDCSTLGKQCDAVVYGEPAKVTLWYNGPMLVEMALEGKDKKATEYHRKLSSDGSTLTVEVIPINSGKEKKTFEYARAGDTTKQQ